MLVQVTLQCIVIGYMYLMYVGVCSLSQQNGNSKSQDGKVFKRIMARLCQTRLGQGNHTNPTLWCEPHKMSLSSAIIEHWAPLTPIVQESFPMPWAFWHWKYSVSVSHLRFEKIFCQCSHAPVTQLSHIVTLTKGTFVMVWNNESNPVIVIKFELQTWLLHRRPEPMSIVNPDVTVVFPKLKKVALVLILNSHHVSLNYMFLCLNLTYFISFFLDEIH